MNNTTAHTVSIPRRSWVTPASIRQGLQGFHDWMMPLHLPFVRLTHGLLPCAAGYCDATKVVLQTVVKAEGNMNRGGVGAATPPFLWTPHTPSNTDTHKHIYMYTNTYTLDRTGKSSGDTPEIREKLALTHFCSVTPHCLNVTERLWATATNGE